MVYVLDFSENIAKDRPVKKLLTIFLSKLMPNMMNILSILIDEQLCRL
jgi:hypothetical protein